MSASQQPHYLREHTCENIRKSKDNSCTLMRCAFCRFAPLAEFFTESVRGIGDQGLRFIDIRQQRGNAADDEAGKHYGSDHAIQCNNSRRYIPRNLRQQMSRLEQGRCGDSTGEMGFSRQLDYLTTMFTSLSGTAITFTMVLPSV